ncbi:IS4 family transposase [Shewanella sp. SW32]|uniref:IS4 family transposase n=1 Tax=unclassified Shewanella TaxID=196818 RepID=UPI0021D8293E|nr:MULTISPECIES: IS4 family transposase [unclassified Shewanella]MCU7961408.1 IS4 family transposase [Shewanella sp. SW32]MCU7969490.1 IS4 family transposase [Shewanella sp. SW29]
MQVLTILHQSLYQHCPEIHQKRLNTLMVACRALINADCLTLTHLGRHIDGTSTHTKHSIKRMDRLLGNPHLHHERMAVYQWHAKWLLTAHTMPTILVDWSDMREGRELIALRASIAIKGRSITLYERTFPLIQQGTQTAHNQFLNELHKVLPDNITPLIVTDAGFRNPWFRKVEQLGWYWLGRVRGLSVYRPHPFGRQFSLKALYPKASRRAKHVGRVALSVKKPLLCEMVLFRAPSKGRKGQRSTTTDCHHTAQWTYELTAKEPWALVTNLTIEAMSPQKLVNIYQKRMQIEETFRDLKSPAYGFGLRHSRTRYAARMDILLLIALLVQLAFWWVGLYGETQQLQRHFQANTVKKRNVLSTLRMGKELLRRRYDYPISADDLLRAAKKLAELSLTHGCWGYEL